MKTILTLVAFVACTTVSIHAQTREYIRYDEVGRVSGVTYITGNQALIVSYEYDLRGNITKTKHEVTTAVNEEGGTPLLIVTVKPNPASNEVSIETPTVEGSEVSFVITTADGRVVHKTTATADASKSARVVLETSKLGMASGKYFVTAQSNGVTTNASFSITK